MRYLRALPLSHLVGPIVDVAGLNRTDYSEKIAVNHQDRKSNGTTDLQCV